MDHAEAELLVDLYADGELDAGLAGRFESHLAECEICAARWRRLNADRAVLALALARQPAPPDLRAKILNAIRDAARREDRRRVTPPWMRYGATIVATALLTGAAMLALTGHAGRRSVTDTVFNDHVRALATHRMIDVASSDQNAVNPWFGGRLSYTPLVDIREKGFPLLGGRVDYIDGQPVAVFVYARGPRLISLFLRPVRRDDRPAHVITRRGGFNIAWWSNGTFECWAVSDVSAGDLLQLRKSFLNGRGGSRL